MKQSIITKLKRAAMYLLGFSATPMLTACYGMPYSADEVDPTPFDDISGVVYSDDYEPIPGIKISSPTLGISTTTDSEGKYYIDHYFETSVHIDAEDIDGKENGEFYNTATIVTANDHLHTNFIMRKKW